MGEHDTHWVLFSIVTSTYISTDDFQLVQWCIFIINTGLDKQKFSV